VTEETDLDMGESLFMGEDAHVEEAEEEESMGTEVEAGFEAKEKDNRSYSRGIL
jgi:hypothetical protein